MKRILFLALAWVAVLLPGVVLGQSQYLLEVKEGDKIIHIDELRLPSSATLEDVIYLLPELLGRPSYVVLNNYDIEIEGFSIGGSKDIVLSNIYASRIKEIKISESPANSYNNNGQGGTVKIALQTPDEGVSGNADLSANTTWNVMPSAQLDYKNKKGDFFMCGQWFVKLGVWQNHAWNAHQYHYNSQFYSDFGTYDVNITVPDGYLVGATGVMKKDITTDKGVRTFEFHAEDVVDFAFAASKRFCIMADTYKGKGIKLLYMPEHGNQAKRHLDAAKHAIDYMSETLSDYEYPNLTLVDLPFYATKASNAQYPMLITTTSIRNTPEDFHVFESQTIRQVVHNYFASIVASNQVEQAWLDEGITSYYEGKIMDKYYGDGSLFKAQSLILNNSDYIRTQYTQSYNPAISSLDCYSWTYPTYTFDMLTKGKASVMFQTLEGLLGKENFDDVMQKFYKKFSFSHPSGADLVALFNQKAQEINNDEIGKDLNWFFRQMLKSDAVCDYKLTSIVNRREGNQLLGYFQDGIEKIFKQDNEGKDFYTSSVYVQRMGDMIMPIDVVVTLENGQTLTFNWNGNGRCKEFVINANSKVISACIDPNQKIACDVNISNNSMTIENNSSPVWKYTSKFLFWLENIFQTISFFA